MKKLTSALVIFACLSLVGCDYIKFPNPVDENGDGSTASQYDTIRSIPNTAFRKAVLEEITGVDCHNCSAVGHPEADRLHDKFGDSLVIIAIHTTNFAVPEPNEGLTYDFRTNIGQELTNFFSINSAPRALTCRENNGALSAWSEWESKVVPFMQQAPIASVQLENRYAATEKQIESQVRIDWLNAGTASKYAVALYIVEDHVIAPQKNGNSVVVPEYDHRHPLRGSLNGTWGDDITNFAQGDSVIFTHSMSLDGTDWNPDNCYVVALLYDKDSYEIVQAEQLSFKQ